MSKAIPAAIVDQAIAWVIRLEMSDAPTGAEDEFRQWLQGDARHQLAWARISQIRRRYAALPSDALGRTLRQIEGERAKKHISRRRALKTLSVTGTALGSAWLTSEYTPWQRLIADQSTATGEQKRLTLADGSELVLNTDSAISTDFNHHRRLLRLHRGEIALTISDDTTHTPQRLFSAETPVANIQALASRFILRLADGRLRVSIQQGAAGIVNFDGGGETLTAGADVWLSSNRISEANTAIPPDAWLQGAIAGENLPLGELLDELARYRPGMIDYSPELATLPVSGVFQLSNTDQTLQFLARTQAIRIDFRTRYWVVVRPA